MMKLSKRQKAFADAYLTNGGNATEAARAAGYSPSDYMRRVDMTNTSYTGDIHAK
ncbi:phage terminase, small subunit [Lacticaseibacillus paracasei]|nr:phage terminase, small subunit [Lacticaseibacillus paracasei]